MDNKDFLANPAEIQGIPPPGVAGAAAGQGAAAGAAADPAALGAIPRHQQGQAQPAAAPAPAAANPPQEDFPVAVNHDIARRPYSPIRYVHPGPLPGQERHVLSKDITFSGSKAPGDISARSLVQEVDSRMHTSNWTEAQATSFFQSCLRDKAAEWFTRHHILDRSEPLEWRQNWSSNARHAFLRRYDSEGDSLLVKPADLKFPAQDHPVEFAISVHNRVEATVRWLITARPGRYNPRLSEATRAAINLIPEPQRAAVRADIDDCFRRQVYEDIEWAGAAVTRSLIPDLIASRYPTLANELRRQNRSIGSPQANPHINPFLATMYDPAFLRNSSLLAIAAVDDQNGDPATDDLAPDALEAPACPVGRRPRGRNPQRNRPNRRNQPPKQPPRPPPQQTCEFCFKPGHSEKECRSKQRARDANRAKATATSQVPKAAAVDYELPGLGNW